MTDAEFRDSLDKITSLLVALVILEGVDVIHEMGGEPSFVTVVMVILVLGLFLHWLLVLSNAKD